MNQAPSSALLTALANRLGLKGFTTDAAEMQPWLTDWRGKYHGRAAAMLSPATTAEVADIVSLATRDNVALVPQGGNSGMVGGATPDASGTQLLLSLRRMNAFRSVDAEARLIVAEAGVILANLHDEAARHGLRFPLTLGGKGSATVGGLVSTNAGGTQVLRHGTMRALVAGLEAVLPDGSVIDALAPLKKDNRGYDPKHLLVGAEGTLGIVTSATLRLVPAIGERAVAWIGVASPDDALNLLRALDDRLGDALEGFELMPQSCIDSVLRHIPQTRAPLSAPSPWNVLVEVVGTGGSDVADTLSANLQSLWDHTKMSDVVIAKSDAEADAFWRIRDSISEAERASGPAVQHDVSVPVAVMPAFIAASARELQAAFPGVRVLSFGHLGDGNVHHHVQPPAGADGIGWLAAHGEAVSAHVYAHVVAMGGSLSAEHGIGQMKRAILSRLSEPARIHMLRAVKSGMDPRGIMNPGKLVP